MNKEDFKSFGFVENNPPKKEDAQIESNKINYKLILDDTYYILFDYDFDDNKINYMSIASVESEMIFTTTKANTMLELLETIVNRVSEFKQAIKDSRQLNDIMIDYGYR